MNDLESIDITPEDQRRLRADLDSKDDVTPFKSDLPLSTMVASLGIQREIGTLNDEMARFVFDPVTDQPIPRKHLKAELVRYHQSVGVRIWARGYDVIELRFRGIHELLHPRFSFDSLGRTKQAVIFPGSVAKILESRGIEPVLVKPWAVNTIFGGFHPAQSYYQTNLWELQNNDAVRFTELISRRQVPFLGSHDLVAHISATNSANWTALAQRGAHLKDILERYFEPAITPSLQSLVLPYVAGVLLDDLAQPPSYDDPTRIVPLDLVMEQIENRAIDPTKPTLLWKFPDHYEKLLTLARYGSLDQVKNRAAEYVLQLVRELQAYSTTARAVTGRSSV